MVKVPGRMIERLSELVNDDEALVWRGRYLDVDFLVEIGDVPYFIEIRQGRIAGVDKEPLPMRAWCFAVRANAAAWEAFWRPEPAPGYQDLFAIAKQGEARIEGDLKPLMTNLRYFKDVLAAPSRLAAGG